MAKKEKAIFWPNLITTPVSERTAEVMQCIELHGSAMVCVNQHSDVVVGAAGSDEMKDYLRGREGTLMGVYDRRATISDVQMDFAAVIGEVSRYGRNRVKERASER